MISKILVTTDGSETALKARRYAIDLAKQLNASIDETIILEKGGNPMKIC